VAALRVARAARAGRWIWPADDCHGRRVRSARSDGPRDRPGADAQRVAPAVGPVVGGILAQAGRLRNASSQGASMPRLRARQRSYRESAPP
jgi:hypothetical protein